MKRIVKITLAALLLVTLLLSTVACGMESLTGYTRLRDHLTSVGKTVELTAPSESYRIELNTASTEDGMIVLATAKKVDGAILTLTFNGSTEKAALKYENGDVKATSTLYFNEYTGDDLITFNEISDRAYREDATDLCNVLIKALDTYTVKTLDMSVTELGFITLSDKYMAPADEVEDAKDLGGAFSVERLKQAGLMLLQGMGMVFLVLSILWLVLIIFKNVFAKDASKAERAQKAAAKAEKKQKKEEAATAAKPAAPATPASAPTPVTDDGALIAAITAAIAATIESDPALASQFVGGFRVVSFKKKNGKTSWNH